MYQRSGDGPQRSKSSEHAITGAEPEMRMNSLTFLGLVAALCSTIAFLPQLIKVWRTRSTHDISREMFFLIVTSATLWLVYGVLEHDYPIIAADLSSLVFATTILYFKFRYG